MLKNKHIPLIGALLAAEIGFSVSSATAAQVEEITVTARKRVESLQDVPIAVTALNAAKVESAHATTITDLEKFIPNVDFADNPFAGQGLGATIRGVGFTDPEKSFEPVVGFSIDGVFLASNTGGAIDAFDIAQIEVLRGPQGTLYGRNTVGGVVNITRTRPTGEFGIKLNTRFTDQEEETYNIIANLPKIAGISTKLYGFDRTSETFAKNLSTNRHDDQTDFSSFGAAFLIEPTDKLEILLSLDKFNDNSQGPPTYNINDSSDFFCVTTINTGQETCAARSIDIAEASDFEDFDRGTPFITHIDGSSATLNVEWDISDDLTLTSITGYRETDDRLLQENIGGPLVALGFLPNVEVAPGVFVDLPFSGEALFQQRLQDADQWSQEIRLSGQLSDKLTFVTGFFYMDADYNLTGGNYPDGSFGTSRALGGAFGPPSDETFDQETQAWALFADGTYQINDKFSISGGIRYSDEEKTAEKTFIISTVPGVSGTSGRDSESWDEVTGRLIAQYEVSDEAMIYAGWSRGFRSGGFNGRAASPGAIGPYDPETVDSFEIGARAEFLDGKVRFNPTIFYADYKDKQEESLAEVDGAIETTVQNASEVEVSGAELELEIQFTEKFSLRSALGYTDAELNEFVDALGNDLRDSRNLRAGPEQTASLGLLYVQPILDGKAQLSFATDASYQSELVVSSNADLTGLGRDTIDANSAVDFAITFATLNENAPNISVTTYINDAFDDGPGRLGTSIHIPGFFTFGVGAPTKTYGIEATLEF